MDVGTHCTCQKCFREDRAQLGPWSSGPETVARANECRLQGKLIKNESDLQRAYRIARRSNRCGRFIGCVCRAQLVASKAGRFILTVLKCFHHKCIFHKCLPKVYLYIT